VEASAPGAQSGDDERRTSPVELLWDLVFVFAITQVTTLLANHLTWTGFGQAMLVLALVWWAWSAFVWPVNAEATDSPTLRLTLLLATVFIFIAGLAVPRAWGSEATLFVCAYAVVRLLHLGLYIYESRRGNASLSAIVGFALTVVIGLALLIVGSVFHGLVRALFWAAAVAIDYAGPAWITRDRLRGLQRVAVAHFAERYSLFVIICIGESIVAIGVGAAREPLDAGLVAAVTLGLLIAIGLWWTYFDRFAAVAEARLREHDDPVLAAADSYSYLHLLLVAGIIIFAAGIKYVVRAADDPLHTAPRLALCGGVALYLIGHLAFRWRMTGEVRYEKAATAGLVLVVFAVGGEMAAWLLTGVVALLVAGLCGVEYAAEPGSHAAPSIGEPEAEGALDHG
jgi:low temperature requirement protein LtrA